MRKLYITLLISCGLISLKGQNVLWQKDIKSATQNLLSGLSVTVDQQFVIAGSSIQPPKVTTISTSGEIKQNNGYDFHLVKLDQNGDEVWEQYFSGNNHDFLVSTISTQEGGFLLAGTTFSSQGLNKKDKSFGDSDIWIIKVAENGIEEWQQSFGTIGKEEAKAVVQCKDLSYIVAGSIQGGQKGFGASDVLLLKLDPNGKLINEIIIGGKGIDEVEKVIATKDGGVLVGVYSRSNTIENRDDFFRKNSSSPISKRSLELGNIGQVSYNSFVKNVQSFGEGDFWLIKLDKDANIEWQRSYGGKADDRLRTITLTDTGYLIGGESGSGKSGNKKSDIEKGKDVWILSINKDGDEIFQKSYNFGNHDKLMSLNTIWDKTGNESNGFLLGGYTQAEGKLEHNDETFWILYIDRKGEEVWRKYVKGESKAREERLVSTVMLDDGSYIFAGTSAKEFGKENWKIVKLGDRQIKDLIIKQEIKVYPNPVSEYCYIDIGFDFAVSFIDIYDMAGSLIQSLSSKNRITKINTQALIQGAYLVVVKVHTKKEVKKLSAKIIKK